MNNNKMWWGIGVVVVVALIAFFAMRSGGTSEPGYGSDQGGTAAQGSLKSLLASGTPQKCTFADKTAEADVSGTVYIANGMMRGDFTTVAGGQTMGGHMVVANNVMNTWIDGMTTGFKIAFDAAATSDQASRGLDANKNMDYKCSYWTADSSVFVLPAGITFTDMGSVTAGANASAGVSGMASQCAACDSAPADYREQCRAALGCK